MSEIENQSLEIHRAIEALLFVSPEPCHINDLATVLGVSINNVENGLVQLEQDLQHRGIRLQRDGGRVQLTTAPEFSLLVEELLGLEATTRLSHAALETLAIIAYQQPVTRPYIEGVRGVSSDGVVKSLLGKGLIQEIGRAEGPGRPILYGTTADFLLHFGLNSLLEMPTLNMPETLQENGHDEMLKG